MSKLLLLLLSRNNILNENSPVKNVLHRKLILKRRISDIYCKLKENSYSLYL